MTPDPYIELLKRTLTGEVHQSCFTIPRDPAGIVGADASRAVRKAGLELARPMTGDERRTLVDEGRGGWPLAGETMIGLRRLENIQLCVLDVLERGIPGDLIEAGVWRGGAAIFMRALLRSQRVEDRRVWAADSFEGLPAPAPERYPADEGDKHHKRAELAVAEETVRANFDRYGLLDDQVRFLKGWFRDTLPSLRHVPWAVIRLDGDMYESTMDGLVHLYPQLSVGGYLIVDDYGALPSCRRAVDDYRDAQGINEPLAAIDWTGVYWRREVPQPNE